YPVLRWIDRGLNWFLMDGSRWPAMVAATDVASVIAAVVCSILIVAPFSHMICIVIRYALSLSLLKHYENACVVQLRKRVFQFVVLLVFHAVPFALLQPAIHLRDSIYADTQTLVMVAELLFACSTAVNSCVAVARNRVYTRALLS
ncbi:hypothetical protein PFISCL1PPCAC_13989, partial [Pristionchus fissidentatus]